MARKRESSEAAQKGKKLDIAEITGKVSNVRRCRNCDGGKKKVKNCVCGGSGKFNIANI